ncbi:LysR family transcriptional regulator [Photobacterium phosphoreum]|jgi:DNA-binding transcriptional LysR family regulator|uniref:LysR family transcriptional regulator n=1 Tax=Photobacterium phosphoreum TaxID=659 RepID=A0A2T3PIY7_PHOPO|nr:LysR family transcriptional regulator [Photobacterium phosphoreum]MCD9463179.1 LysR family transcriptional regulator [Photobacterium phosphoreum]MCD9470514.1 LysR family transcriptional regulator [Photobacterium phosphoreum]MCD9474275.1 LysR family transcriptional regulator [Photobacterium phosphoreum]MCD9479306.1 LysR family transcriptional regulator [Photobacterium phosphoreum]MCD9484492.1 LysR family transcriptional regulator [Photobacterium phosphoreum]
MDRFTSMLVFVQAVDLGSYSAVAEEQQMSPQMVGKHVRHLEQRLGAKLLNKSTRQQSLTQLGQQYYQRCKTVLAEVKAAEDEASRYLNAPRGLIKLASSITVGYILTPVIAKFMHDYHEIDIELVLTNRSVDLINEGFDAVIRLGVIENSRLIARKLISYKNIPCASPLYLQQHGIPNHPTDLNNHQCLHSHQSESKKMWRFHGSDGDFMVNLHSRLIIDNGQAQLLAAIQGLGITLQPYPMVAHALDTGKLIRVLDQYQASDIDIHIVYPVSQRLTPKFTAFLEYLLTTLPLTKMNPVVSPHPNQILNESN